MRVCLFEDRLVEDLEPLTLTRPAFDLLCGQTTLAEKQWRPFGERATGALVRPHLADLQRAVRPGLAVNDPAWLGAGPAALVNGRWLPDPGVVVDLSRPCVATVGDEVAFAVVDRGRLGEAAASNVDAVLAALLRELPRVQTGGRLVRHLWELVDLNGEQVALDPPLGGCGPRQPVPEGVAVVGPAGLLVVALDARVEPTVVADTTGGPVVVDRGAVVTAFTRLEGPCYVGPGTHVLGAKVRAGTSLGPHCRVGGEVEASVMLGYSNKYHDGFLGHAYVGEWVNLGAGTHNSDLRNDYGPVSVTVNGRRVDTGRTKVGCFLGDHTKTALGVLLNTGSNVGAFCNLLPGGLLPSFVPSFCHTARGGLAESADGLALFDTAAKVMARRGVALTEAHAELYHRLLARTEGERRRALREAEQRRVRQSA
jgi:UDP-N-acetylglucosamine diphosphorylase / glucose-1-phosphate thymidylyltransferase / UDP-N-acetylgalactosamine diphosphorylase / glucosamine-1-phosphate N-acetyltransferase / galactosamine-1-phosphate N-acetyltransferase